MIYVETPRLVLRNWRESDRDLFREINADPKVMEYFPGRRSYSEADAMLERVRRMIVDHGIGFFAMAIKDTDEPIGFCGLALPSLEPHLPKGTVEIGWRLATRFWGNGYVTEAARALLRFGFIEHDMTEIVSFAVADNRRSTAVMERIGMVADPAGDFDHPRVPDSHPHLKRHVLYRLTAEQFHLTRQT